MLEIWRRILSSLDVIFRSDEETIAAIAFALLVSTPFVIAFVMGRTYGFDRALLAVGISIVGGTLVAIVFFGSLRKARAKRLLGYFLAGLPFEQISYVEAMLLDPHYNPAYPATYRNDGRQADIGGWFKLIGF